MSWGRKKFVRRLLERLAVTTGEHFEREILPFLRLLFPRLVQAPRLKTWDQRGIDLLVLTESQRLPCAIQCKGFELPGIDDSQLKQMETSIAKFKKSGIKVQTYLLVHNRYGASVDEATQGLLPLLSDLVNCGQAQRAELLSLEGLLVRVLDGLAHRTKRKLKQHSKRLRIRFEKMFRFSGQFISKVPADKRLITFKRDSRCEVSPTDSHTELDVSKEIASRHGHKWTIVTGLFGTGKTTSALQACGRSGMPIILIPCATLPTSVLSGSSSLEFAEHLVNYLGIGADEGLEPDVRRLAGSVMKVLLKRTESRFILLLDGLDENHFFSSLTGLQRLSNQLSKFSCSVILTTRKEHFNALIGDYNVAFSQLGRRRLIRSVELTLWREKQVTTLLNQAVQAATIEERDRLILLRKQIHTGAASKFYGDLIQHPLFLQFILEDVSAAGVTEQSRPSLVHRWLERKLLRDRQTWAPKTVEYRTSVAPGMDTDEFLSRMVGLLAEFAFTLHEESDGKIDLLEGAPKELVTLLTAKHFTTKVPSLLTVLQHSVLEIYDDAGKQFVGFALRVLHEYLSALYIVENRLSWKGWPCSVAAFIVELGPKEK